MVARIIWLGLIVALSVAAPGCAREVKRPAVRYYEAEVRVTDEPAARLFRLELHSFEDAPFCIDADGWPDAKGRPRAGSRQIRLRWKGGIVFAKDGFEEYCPGGCRVVVPAGQTLSGFVKYEAFGDPEWVASLEDRKLEVRIVPFECPRG